MILIIQKVIQRFIYSKNSNFYNAKNHTKNRDKKKCKH